MTDGAVGAKWTTGERVYYHGRMALVHAVVTIIAGLAALLLWKPGLVLAGYPALLAGWHAGNALFAGWLDRVRTE